MSDNSPDYFKQLATRLERLSDEASVAISAAAAQARENAELREAIRGGAEYVSRTLAAESANRALQAEVDRLRRELRGIGRAALAWSEPHPSSEGHMP